MAQIDSFLHLVTACDIRTTQIQLVNPDTLRSDSEEHSSSTRLPIREAFLVSCIKLYLHLEAVLETQATSTKSWQGRGELNRAGLCGGRHSNPDLFNPV